MLSICIPVYNMHLSKLVSSLHQQASTLNIPSEILLIDDASRHDIRMANKDLQRIPGLRLEELKENIGRSRIRNMLAQKARYPLLLFLDCDVEIQRPDFLKRYLEAGKDGSVVCGGHVYQAEKPLHPYIIHWLSGVYRETKEADERQKNPYHSFMTSCFLIPAGILYQLPFNEELQGYGHEDTLYGYQLKQRNVMIKHIDNPVVHAGLEPAPLFLEKTRNAMVNLKKVYQLTGNDQEFVKMVRVLKKCEQLKKWGLLALFNSLYRMAENRIEKKLCSRYPKLWMLDVFKLGNICKQPPAVNKQLH